jgi:glycosyltransferase involved in cell wall biosynthesis
MTERKEPAVDPSMEGSPSAPDLRDVRTLVLFGGSVVYGQERANLAVMKAMADLGMHVRFVTNARWGAEWIEPELARHGFTWTRAMFGPLLGKNLLGLDGLRAVVGLVTTSAKVLRECAQWRPTHFYVMNTAYFFFALPALSIVRLPLIYRLGDSPTTHTRYHRWLWRRICRRSATVVCVSRFIKSQVDRQKDKPSRTQVVVTLPQCRTVTSSTASATSVAGQTVITYVGQIREHKGVRVLIDAVRLLLTRRRDVVLWLAGEHCLEGNSEWQNDDAKRLMSEVSAAGLTNTVQFLGYIEDVPALLRRSHIHVCPSIWPDPLPNVVLEAKEQGLPSVVFPVGGLPEVVEHVVDGYVCSSLTAEALADGIDYFVTDPPRRLAACRAAREAFKAHYGADRFALEWASVFHENWRRPEQ